MPKFLLLLQVSPNRFNDLSPEQIQKIIGSYIARREDLVRRNKMLGGEKLTNEGGKQLKNENGKVTVTDGPYSELQEVLGGFFMIQAADYAEAVEIAKTCPHILSGQPMECASSGWSALKPGASVAESSKNIDQLVGPFIPS